MNNKEKNFITITDTGIKKLDQLSKPSIRRKRLLTEAYGNMLVSAKKKLARAIEKKNQWDIDHYNNDIKILENEMSNINLK